MKQLHRKFIHIEKNIKKIKGRKENINSTHRRCIHINIHTKIQQRVTDSSMTFVHKEVLIAAFSLAVKTFQQCQYFWPFLSIWFLIIQFQIWIPHKLSEHTNNLIWKRSINDFKSSVLINSSLLAYMWRHFGLLCVI